jgi:hypothetical protein
MGLELWLPVESTDMGPAKSRTTALIEDILDIHFRPQAP